MRISDQKGFNQPKTMSSDAAMTLKEPASIRAALSLAVALPIERPCAMKMMTALSRSTRLFGSPILGSALACVLTACSTMKVPEFKVRETASYQFATETNGLMVAVQPVTDKKQLKETFQVDLVNKGIVPILVVVENRSNSSFLVAKEKVHVVNASASTNSSVGRKVASGSGGEQTAMAGAALLGVAVLAAPAAVVVAAPLVIAGAKAASNADVIRHNLADKGLTSHTVEPGKRAYGYLYFDLPKGEKFGGRQVLVELTDTATSQPLTFVFNVQ